MPDELSLSSSLLFGYSSIPFSLGVGKSLCINRIALTYSSIVFPAFTPCLTKSVTFFVSSYDFLYVASMSSSTYCARRSLPSYESSVSLSSSCRFCTNTYRSNICKLIYTYKFRLLLLLRYLSNCPPSLQRFLRLSLR